MESSGKTSSTTPGAAVFEFQEIKAVAEQELRNVCKTALDSKVPFRRTRATARRALSLTARGARASRHRFTTRTR